MNVYAPDVNYFKIWLVSIASTLFLWLVPFFFGKYTDTTFPYIPKGDIVQELVGSVGPASSHLPWCPVVSPHIQDMDRLLNSNVEMLSDEEIVKENALRVGGAWNPQDCQSRYQVAIIVPYRNRSQNLQQFLTYMHPFLTRQQLSYRIVVVEQTSGVAFNRAKLFNIGFLETLKLNHVDCFIFHDVDLLPRNDLNTYACTHNPRHMYSSVDMFRYNLPYRHLFGGASAILKVHFQKVNGFSNKFYGWGGEDDDMYNRMNDVGLTFVRFDPSIASYIMLLHHSDLPPENRNNVLWGDTTSTKHDGLSNISYQVVDHQLRTLYTWFLVSC